MPVVVLVLGVMGAVLALKRVFVIATVKGESMLPAYVDQDRVLVFRQGATKLRRGVVVVVEVPSRPDQALWDLPPHRWDVAGRVWMIKRVAATAGDLVPKDFFRDSLHQHGDRVPPGQLLVIGDDFEHSFDSRLFGYVPTSRVLGRAVRTVRQH